MPRTFSRKMYDDLLAVRLQHCGQRKVVGGRRGISSEIRLLAFLKVLKTEEPYASVRDRAKVTEETVRLYLNSFVEMQ